MNNVEDIMSIDNPKISVIMPSFNEINYIEKAIGCPIKYVSVGPERDSIIIK